MKVKELIEKLSSHHPDAEVRFGACWWEETEQEDGSWHEEEIEIEKEITLVSEEEGVVYIIS